MKRLFGFLKPHKPLLIALIFVNVLLSAMLIVAPLVIKQIVDVVIGEQQMQLLLPYLAVLLLVMAVRAVATYFYSFGQNKLGQLVMTDVRGALYRKLLALPYTTIMVAATPAAILFFVTAWIGVHQYAIKFDLKAMAASELPGWARVVRTLPFFAVPFGILIFVLGWTAYADQPGRHLDHQDNSPRT